MKIKQGCCCGGPPDFDQEDEAAYRVRRREQIKASIVRSLRTITRGIGLGVAVGLVAALLTGCTTIKTLTVVDPKTGETLNLSGYSSGKDVEITTPSGWVVKANASNQTKAIFEGVAPIVSQAVGAAVANSVAGKTMPVPAASAPLHP